MLLNQTPQFDSHSNPPDYDPTHGLHPVQTVSQTERDQYDLPNHLQGIDCTRHELQGEQGHTIVNVRGDSVSYHRLNFERLGYNLQDYEQRVGSSFDQPQIMQQNRQPTYFHIIHPVSSTA